MTSAAGSPASSQNAQPVAQPHPVSISCAICARYPKLLKGVIGGLCRDPIIEVIKGARLTIMTARAWEEFMCYICITNLLAKNHVHKDATPKRYSLSTVRH